VRDWVEKVALCEDFAQTRRFRLHWTDRTAVLTIPFGFKLSRRTLKMADSETKAFCDPEELGEMMRRGDLQALERMTRCFGDRLLAVGLRHCKDADQALDAIQDAMVSGGENLTSFTGKGSPEGWMSRIVANACHRMRRGRKNDPALHAALDDQVPDEFETGPDEVLIRREFLAGLGEAMLELSATDRAVFLLAEGHGWTGPEIAESVDLSAAAVRVRLTRIRKRLRSEMTSRGLISD